MSAFDAWRAEMGPEIAAILDRHVVGPDRIDEAAARVALDRHYRTWYRWLARDPDEPAVGRAWRAEVRARLAPAGPRPLEPLPGQLDLFPEESAS